MLGDITVYQPSWHATLTAPDESRGRDETGRASPVVAFLPFTPYITGSIPHGDTTLDISAMIIRVSVDIQDTTVGVYSQVEIYSQI